MYSLRLRLRLSKIRHIEIICLKTKTKSDKWYFDSEIKIKTIQNFVYIIKTKTKTIENSVYIIKTKTRQREM